MVRLKVYAIVPMDDWTGWITFPEFQHRYHDIAYDLRAQLAAAKADARNLGWEGDGASIEQVMVTAIPDEVSSSFVLGWKQESNGTTFIATPKEMPWLDQLKVL